jgi:hypothetical protein
VKYIVSGDDGGSRFAAFAPKADGSVFGWNHNDSIFGPPLRFITPWCAGILGLAATLAARAASVRRGNERPIHQRQG